MESLLLLIHIGNFLKCGIFDQYLIQLQNRNDFW